MLSPCWNDCGHAIRHGDNQCIAVLGCDLCALYCFYALTHMIHQWRENVCNFILEKSAQSFPVIQGLQLNLQSTTVSPICCDDAVHHLALGLCYHESPYVASVYLGAIPDISVHSWLFQLEERRMLHGVNDGRFEDWISGLMGASENVFEQIEAASEPFEELVWAFWQDCSFLN